MAQSILDDFKATLQIPDKIALPGTSATVDLRRVDKTVDNATDLLFASVIALLIIIGGWLVSMWLASFMQRMLVRARIELTLAAFLGSMVRYSFFITCLVLALKELGVSLTSMVAIFGAIGLAVAFALRSTLTHVAAGIMLIINRPFRVGDFIELDFAGMMGTVKRITLFNTEINTLQNKRVFLPNSKIWEGVLQNHTYNEVRVVEKKVSFSYEDSPEDCKKLLREVFAANELVLTKPEPFVETSGFGDSAINYNFRIAARTRDFGAVSASILDEIWHAANKAGLTMPYPQLVVQTITADTAKAPARTTKKEKKQ